MSVGEVTTSSLSLHEVIESLDQFNEEIRGALYDSEFGHYVERQDDDFNFVSGMFPLSKDSGLDHTPKVEGRLMHYHLWLPAPYCSPRLSNAKPFLIVSTQEQKTSGSESYTTSLDVRHYYKLSYMSDDGINLDSIRSTHETDSKVITALPSSSHKKKEFGEDEYIVRDRAGLDQRLKWMSGTILGVIESS